MCRYHNVHVIMFLLCCYGTIFTLETWNVHHDVLFSLRDLSVMLLCRKCETDLTRSGVYFSIVHMSLSVKTFVIDSWRARIFVKQVQTCWFKELMSIIAISYLLLQTQSLVHIPSDGKLSTGHRSLRSPFWGGTCPILRQWSTFWKLSWSYNWWDDLKPCGKWLKIC